MSSSECIVTYDGVSPSFARGLAFGLVLGVAFWTLVAIAIWGV